MELISQHPIITGYIACAVLGFITSIIGTSSNLEDKEIKHEYEQWRQEIIADYRSHIITKNERDKKLAEAGKWYKNQKSYSDSGFNKKWIIIVFLIVVIAGFQAIKGDLINDNQALIKIGFMGFLDYAITFIVASELVR